MLSESLPNPYRRLLGLKERQPRHYYYKYPINTRVSLIHLPSIDGDECPAPFFVTGTVVAHGWRRHGYILVKFDEDIIFGHGGQREDGTPDEVGTDGQPTSKHLWLGEWCLAKEQNTERSFIKETNMPIYEFVCPVCQRLVETLYKTREEFELTELPSCAGTEDEPHAEAPMEIIMSKFADPIVH